MGHYLVQEGVSIRLWDPVVKHPTTLKKGNHRKRMAVQGNPSPGDWRARWRILRFDRDDGSSSGGAGLFAGRGNRLAVASLIWGGRLDFTPFIGFANEVSCIGER